MDLETLQIFLEINSRHSISGAASALFLSQCTVSRKLAMLEQDLGIELFIRGKGHSQVILTPAGESFVQIAEKMIALQHEALGLKDHSPRIALSVAVIESINTYVLQDFFPKMLREHPELSMTLAVQHSWEVHDLIEGRNADIGITNNESPYAELASQLLFQEEFVVVHKDFGALQWPELLHPSDLAPEHEIHQSFSPDYNLWHNYWWRPSQAKIHISIASLGEPFFDTPEDWAIIPYSIARTLRKRGFCLSRLSDPPPKRSCYLITRKNMQPYSRQAIQHVTDQLRAYLDNYWSSAGC